MSDSLIYLMSYDEWDLSQEERDAIKAIIFDRNVLKAKVDGLNEFITAAFSESNALKAEVARLRSALEFYATLPSEYVIDDGETAREALEATK